jgi:hypothetical protein
MADILFYLSAYAFEKAHHKIQQKRSPLVPFRPPSPPAASIATGDTPSYEGQDLAPVYTREPVPIPESSPSASSNDSPHLSRSSSSIPSPVATVRPTPRTRSQSHSPTAKAAPLLTEHKLRESKEL